MNSSIAAAGQVAALVTKTCPIAPPGAQGYADTLTGYVLWGVLAMFGAGVAISIGSIVGGRILSMPHASKAGVAGLAMIFVAAIAYMVVPAMIAGITKSGCV